MLREIRTAERITEEDERKIESIRKSDLRLI